MLELRPTCENCNKSLPPESTDAMICTFECTFCSTCVASVLSNVCPNCGGGFAPRPIRPAEDRRPGLGLASRPASTERVHLSYSTEEVAAFAAQLRDIPPEQR